MHLALLLAAALWSTWHAPKPFFVYGASFFYERTPVAQWRSDLERYRAMGINTIDLYLMWNWHEPDAHTIDFDGRTNPQRNLRKLFRLIHSLGFKVIVRPGPVIRNEWRNGGYPDWLLKRPEYNMPLHDILEGRYPATATLQNAHADAAANEWLHNPVHMKYAAKWLHDVLTEIEPWSRDVIAIALDDDQGAYLDNDTYPAPHWHAYINWLKAQVQATAGTRVPLFINTYQMKVTAATPVWAWGNWYQSDAYRIDDHDIEQLAFSIGLLQTQPGNKPLMTSEFQAGWLQGANETKPRASAPENTTIALHEMLQMGVHGIVNFPLQDTRNPAGYEAPWANWFYGWGAALDVNGNPSPRYGPTAAFGEFVRRYGALLVTMHPVVDRAVAWRGDAGATIAQLAQCRALALSCRLYDPRFQKAPHATGHSSSGGLRDAALLVTAGGRRAILDVFNAGLGERDTARTSVVVGGRRYVIPPLHLAPGAAIDIPLGFTPPPAHPIAVLPHATPLPVAWRTVAPGSAIAYELDVFHDEMPTYVLDNGVVRVVVSANAGARSFIYEDDRTGKNYFNTIGALRDDVPDPPTPSPRDYIAAYTHPIPAGTFNRPYDCRVLDSGTRAELRCTYTAPDLAPQPVRFEKSIVLLPGATGFDVTFRSTLTPTKVVRFSPP